MVEIKNEDSSQNSNDPLSEVEIRLKEALLQRVQKHSIATLDQLRDEVDELTSLNIK